MNTPLPFFQSITLSNVVLRVRKLEPMIAFYRELLGFKIVAQEPERVGLSPDGRAPSLFVLQFAPEAPSRSAGSSGLFHAAILYPDRGSLGQIAQKLATERIRFATGDHGVSEALYLDDPEGNGIELYVDRPIAAWPRPSGPSDVIGMYTEAVDLRGLLLAAEDHTGPLMPEDTRLGHVHLSVVNLSASEHFYHQLLGFDVMVRSFPGAVFLGRDGYHHHLGANVWRSRTSAIEGELGLVHFTIHFTRFGEFGRVAKALGKEEGVNGTETFTVRDPSGIEIVVTGAAS